MRICIPCAAPGGPDAAIVDSLEESEILDYYEIHPDGNFEHIAQTRSCLGGCIDVVDSIVKREVKATVVSKLSPNSLLRLRSAGVTVYATSNPSVMATIDLLVKGELEEIGLDKSAEMSKK